MRVKLIHISDLHLGKRLHECSLLEDQAYILERILDVIGEERPDGVLIAGDVYDKSVPSGEAVQLFDRFLCRLADRRLQVFVISGNHDSPERLAFGGRLMEASGIHLSPVYSGVVTPAVLQDAYGEVGIYMLPFVRPAHVRRFDPAAEVETYTDAVRLAVEKMAIDHTRRNVLMTHQFVAGAQRAESEELSVGGTDQVDAAVFAGFDYVALGHLHSPQRIGAETIRYCGTPLKYSFSEAAQQKSVTIVELGPKGAVTVRTAPLTPRRELRELRGTYEELTDRRRYAGTATDDYLHITLLDEEDVLNAVGRLRVIYPNLLKLDYDNRRTRAGLQLSGPADPERKSPLELFSEFYEAQNGRPMSGTQRRFAAGLMERIWGEDG